MEEIFINDVKYRQYTDENNNTYLKRYNEKYKIWVTLKFSNENDIHCINNFIEVATNILKSA